jgi:hypothetical protein
VPDAAQVLVFSGSNANPAELDLRQLDQATTSSTGTVTLGVDLNRSYWNDLSRSFGAKGVQPYDFKVQVDRQ